MDTTVTALRRDTRVIGLVGTAHAFSHFYQLVLPPLFPLIHAQEGYSYTELGLLISLFYAASGILQTPVGFAVDRVGARPMLFAGLFLLAGSTVLYGIVDDYASLVVLVILAGAGNSVFHPTDFSILSTTVDEGRMGRAFSFHAFAGLVGYGVAPLAMVVLAGSVGWQAAMVVVGIVGLVFLAAMVAMSGDFRDSATVASDTPGGGSVALLLRLPVIMFLLYFIVIAMAHVGLQTFTPAALIALHDTPLTVATAAVTGFLIAMPVGVLAGGVLADRTARHDTLVIICMAVPAVLVVIAGLAPLGDVARIGLFVLSGAVFGVVFPARDLLVRAIAPQESSGKVFGFVYSGLDIGSAFTPVAFGWMIDHGNAPWTFLTVGICFVLAIVTVAVSAQATRRVRVAESG